MLCLCLGSVFASGSNAVEVARRARIFAWEHSEFESAEEIAKLMKKCNANALWFHGISQYGNYAFYDSKFFPRHPGLKRDLLKELSDEFKKHDDLYLFPYQSLGYYIAIGQNPEWRTVGANGENHFSNWCGFNQVGVCLNNPNYIGTFAQACKEMVSNYHVMGMFFDGPRWNWTGSCYCQHCRKFVKDTFGVEPDNAAMDKFRA